MQGKGAWQSPHVYGGLLLTESVLYMVLMTWLACGLLRQAFEMSGFFLHGAEWPVSCLGLAFVPISR